MNFFKRALLSIQRKLGKTIILFVIVFILGNIIAGAIAVNQATINVEKNVKSKLGATATVQIDYEKWDKEHGMDEKPVYPKEIDAKQIEEIGQLDMVKTYDYSAMGGFRSNELKNYTEEGENNYRIMEEETEFFQVTGVQQPAIVDVEVGKAMLVDGRIFTADDIKSGKNYAVVAKQFAEHNNLSVGSTAKFLNVVIDWYMPEGTEMTKEPPTIAEREVELEIIGIIDPILKVSKGEQSESGRYDDTSWQNQEKMNKIYVPNSVINAENEFERETLYAAHPEMETDENYTYWRATSYSSIFILKSPDEVENFRSVVTPMLPEYNRVVASSDSYDQISGSMKTMNNLSKMVLIVAIVATLLILTLLIILFIRDRKHEFGIYLSLGEQKIKVVLQIVIEVVLVSFVAMTLSLVTGNILATAVSSSMIQSQLESGQEENYGGAVYYGDGVSDVDLSEEDVIENYEVKITPTYIAMFYGIGLLTIIGATVIPTLYVLRLNPKKIMM